MLSGKLPFSSKEKQEIINQTLAAKIDLTGESWESVSEEAKDLITGFLKPDPKQRIGVIDAMQHRFLLGSAAEDAEVVSK
jgi:serine/threonine protein kinase